MKANVVQDGFRKVGPAQAGLGEDGAAEARFTQIAVIESGTSQIGLIKAGPLPSIGVLVDETGLPEVASGGGKVENSSLA